MNDYEDLRDKPYGNVLTNGQLSFNGTARMARWRLDVILMIDRAALDDPRSCIRYYDWPTMKRHGAAM